MNAIVSLLSLLLLVTPAIAPSTNEGSYKFRFSVGFNDCFDNDALDCGPPNNGAPLRVCNVNNPVTNSTACRKSDLKDCGQFTMEG